jgi:hypothetical protein
MRLLQRRRFPVAHFVLIDDAARLAPERLVGIARRGAERLARRCGYGPQHFTLIHNGSGLARRALPHVHIVCARARWQKALVYLYIGFKNLFDAGR